MALACCPFCPQRRQGSWCLASHSPLQGLEGCCRTGLRCLWPWLRVHIPHLFLGHILSLASNSTGLGKVRAKFSKVGFVWAMELFPSGRKATCLPSPHQAACPVLWPLHVYATPEAKWEAEELTFGNYSQTSDF